MKDVLAGTIAQPSRTGIEQRAFLYVEPDVARSIYPSHCFSRTASNRILTPKALRHLAQGWREAATLGHVFYLRVQLWKICGMSRVDDAATPLGLNVVMSTVTPGSRCCGNPGLVGITPLAYLLYALT